jgi:hypothetical protein
MYGIIHASALASCLFALIAMEIKASRLLKLYVCMLVLIVLCDVTWLCMYTAAIATEKSGMSTTTATELAASMKWGSAATRINKWVCLFAEFMQLFIRVLSLPLWVVMWIKGLLDGTDTYEDPTAGSQGGMSPQTYHPPGEFSADFSHVWPAGPVPEGRIIGKSGGGRSQNFMGFTQGVGYQQEESDSL